ncbi:MAG: hypothetical protein M3Q58_01875 [Bacteroidota bacterium]|nr:hypothetical protein [Bacteroidota bacterium]
MKTRFLFIIVLAFIASISSMFGQVNFQKGLKISEIPSNFKIVEKTEYGEEGSGYLVYELYSNNLLSYTLIPETYYDEASGESKIKQPAVIGEFTVYTSELKTPKGIGVGSTIQEFVTAYPAYSIWYTYVSDRFVIDTEAHRNLQFEINDSDFIGDRASLESGDSDALNINQFKPSTKIKSVRVY